MHQQPPSASLCKWVRALCKNQVSDLSLGFSHDLSLTPSPGLSGFRCAGRAQSRTMDLDNCRAGLGHNNDFVTGRGEPRSSTACVLPVDGEAQAAV